jgi:ATP-binding cassette, subfamily B, bacterial PglK
MNFLEYGKKYKKELLILYFSYLIISIFEIFGIGLIPLYVILISSPEIIIDQIDASYGFTQILNNYQLDSLILYFSIFFIIFFIFKNIISIVFFTLEKKILSKIITNNALNIYSYYLNKSFLSFQNSSSAEIIKNISHSNTQAGMAIQAKLMLLKEITFLVILFVTLLTVNFKITIISIVFLLSFAISFFLFFKKRITKLGKTVEKNQQEQIEILNQTFFGFREIIIFQIKKFMTNKFFLETKSLNNKMFSSSFYQRLPRVFFEILAIIMISTLVYILTINFKDNSLIFPILSLYAICFIRLIPSFTIINSNLKLINYLKIPEEIIIKILGNHYSISKKSNEDLNNDKTNFKINEINIENLTFKYEKNNKNYIFNNFSLDIKKGDKILLMGESGQGKSTLLDLIIGLIDPQKGNVKINNLSVSRNKDLIYSRIGYVPQKVFLFDDTILNNLFFEKNKSEIEIDNIREILADLRLSKFINTLPDGLNTKIGSMGSKLSGGQLQRIGIARALIRDPDLIILDESTNSLDEKMEGDIMSIFYKEKFKDKIIICISHNKNNIQYFNKLLELKDNQILTSEI